MPGQSAHSIKKSKVSKIAKVRKDGNQKVVDSAVLGDLEDAEFGRVLKHLGDSRVRVLTSSRSEGNAVIRGLLRKRGCTPINTDNIVILSKRDYESRSDTKEAVYDVMAVLSNKDIEKLKKNGILPDWFVLGADKKLTECTTAFEFEYVDPKEGGEDRNEDRDKDRDKDENVDIDDI